MIGRVDNSVYYTYFAHWSRHFWLPALAICICIFAQLDVVRLWLLWQCSATGPTIWSTECLILQPCLTLGSKKM